jgi:hypothetical protein
MSIGGLYVFYIFFVKENVYVSPMLRKNAMLILKYLKQNTWSNRIICV